jgi:hypothetical protein
MAKDRRIHVHKALRFSKRQLLIFALIFGLIGGYFIWKSFAAPNPNLTSDLNNDNTVNVLDLSILLSNYSTTASAADINNDGTVNILDLSTLLSHYGNSYTPPSGGPNCSRTLVANDNLQNAIDSAAAGTTLCLPAGSIYNTSLNIENSHGSSGSPITITSANRANPATINGRIVTKPGGDYFTFSYLKLEFTDVNLQGLPSPTIGSDHITLLHNDITTNHTTICINDITDSTWGTAHYTVIDSNRIHDCGQLPPANHDHGIYDSGYYTTIINNYIYNNADRGIQLRGAQGTLARYNTVDNNGEGVIFGDLTAANDEVAYNIFSNSNVRFNAETYWGDTPVGSGNTLHDNCFWTTVTGYYASNQSISSDMTGVAVSNVIFADPQYNNAANGNYTLKSNTGCSGYGVQPGVTPGIY